MKREFLKNFKMGEQELSKEVIDAILDENGNDLENIKSKFADYETVKAQLVEASKTIEGFKGMDIESVRKEADEWKRKAEQAEQDAVAKIADMEFNGLLASAITGAKGRNAKAVTALLDVDALKSSKNRETDIKTALDGLKKESAYLFESAQVPAPYATGTGNGSAPLLGKSPKEMTYSELCTYMDHNPNQQI